MEISIDSFKVLRFRPRAKSFSLFTWEMFCLRVWMTHRLTVKCMSLSPSVTGSNMIQVSTKWKSYFLGHVHDLKDDSLGPQMRGWVLSCLQGVGRTGCLNTWFCSHSREMSMSRPAEKWELTPNQQDVFVGRVLLKFCSIPGVWCLAAVKV